MAGLTALHAAPSGTFVGIDLLSIESVGSYSYRPDAGSNVRVGSTLQTRSGFSHFVIETPDVVFEAINSAWAEAASDTVDAWGRAASRMAETIDGAPVSG